MLTVDLDRLRLGSGDSLLDMGCGGGRHAFAALRRGARVVAFDADGGELKAVRDMVEAMQVEAEIPASGTGLPVQGDALALPFADGAFDRIIAAEVLEHIPDDRSAMAELARVLTPGGRMAVSVPARFPERINWALDSEYHDFPGGHIRIYRQHELESRLEDVGLVLRGSHHAHALHSPYWWIRCAGGVNNADRLLARRYHDVLVWQIMKNPPVLRYLDRALNPVLGKSLVRVRGEAVRATVDAIAGCRPRDGHIPWVVGGKDGSVEHGRGGHGARRRRTPRRRGPRLRVARGPAAAARRLVLVLRRRRGGRPHAATPTCRPTLRSARGTTTCRPATRRSCTRTGRSSRGSSTTCWLQQSPGGAIAWRADDPADGALLTGSSSVHMSLRCAIATAEHLLQERPDWELALDLLATAIAHRPDDFLDKSRWAMDWYYPILGGVAPGRRRARADRRRLGRRSWSRASACAACRTGRGSRPPRRASW